MINLLPPAIKQDYGYGLRNTVLSRWVVAFLIALVGVGAIGTYGWVVMNKSISTYQSQVASTQKQLDKENLKGVEAQVQDISNSFKLVVQVLSKEVLFSKLLQQIGTTIPKNAVLSDLTISQVQGAIDITAQASDYNTATQVQVNLADPKNQIFSKADILNIVCVSGTDASSNPFPCTVTIRALFGPNNQFLFINNKGS